MRPRAVVAGLRGRMAPIVCFALSYELLRWLILAPIAAGLLRLSLERWGRCSVGNFEIIAFLLSPPGLAGLVAMGTVALTTFYVELAGLVLLLADRQAAWWSVFPALGRCALRLLGLGLRQVLMLMALAAPFLVIGGVVVRVLWADRDLNGLLILKPPVFWIVVSIGAGLGGVYTLLAGYFVLRWLLALPVVLFEPGTGGGLALRRSAQYTRGRLAMVCGAVVVWLLAVLLLAGVLLGGMRLGAGWSLGRVGLSLGLLLPVTAAVLILDTLLAAFLSIVSTASLAALVLALYRNLTGAVLPVPILERPAPAPRTRLPARWRIIGVTAGLIAALSLLCYALLARVRVQERLEITAHRGGAALAPENTVAAVRQAIAAAADWAEIDVQRTADGAVVVLHDSDMVRVGGAQLRVAESTLAQIKAVDVGSRFGAEFRGERVPTLDELIAAVGDQIRLNIELKPNGPDDVVPLVDAVLDSLERAGITDRCRLCSQSYESLQLARQRVPGLFVGFIAGVRLGDLSKLDVSFLMVSQRLATRRLAEAAGVHEMEVHAWTINDPQALAALLDRGVANVITDDPVAMRRRLEEIQRLSLAERLLLRARNLLAD